MVFRRWGVRGIAMGLVGCFWLVGGPQARPAQAQQNKYTGAASCSASNCHGSTKPKADFPKLDESVQWAKKDRHAQAYAALLNEKLKSGVSPSKIAKGLNLAKAEASERCLTCHAVNVPVALRGPKFDVTEGVHCDGCHGPAEKWLEPHAEKGWTHEQSVKVGMYDTKNLLLRAEKCVSCHLQIDTDMVAAGHPEPLTIELDTFSENMPPHWATKGAWTRTRIWGLGQVISLREAAKQVGARAKANASAKLMDEALSKVRGHFVIAKHLLAVTAPPVATGLGQDVAALNDAVTKGDKATAQTLAAKISTAAAQEAPKIATRDFDQATTQRLIKSVAGDADAIGAAGIKAAELAAMSLDRLSSTYFKGINAKADKSVSDALDAMFGAVEDPAKYDAKEFVAQVKAFDKSFK